MSTKTMARPTTTNATSMNPLIITILARLRTGAIGQSAYRSVNHGRLEDAGSALADSRLVARGGIG
jgi:hypothetical protein